MAANETTICNLALGRLGAARIMSLDDDTTPAKACKLFYENTRDEVLRSYRWNFAMKRETLSRLSQAPAFGWAAQYALPTDCLRVVQLNGFEIWEPADRYEIEGRRLLTDEDSADIKYIAQITDANLFDALFKKALAVKLAAEIAKDVTGSASMSESLNMEFERLTGAKAMRANAFERRPKRKFAFTESDLVRARH